MSENEDSKTIQSAITSERGPSGTSEALTQGRETLVATILAALLLVDLGLIYLLYRQLTYAIASNDDLAVDVCILVVVSIISITVLRVAVSRYKIPAETIPNEDRALLEDLIRSENTKAIELYVRLASLGGPTGTATKLGLTGLPLATIGLTIFFAVVALFVPTFLDLAKLTLGAFIGSFVQRSGEALERAARAQPNASGQASPATQKP